MKKALLLILLTLAPLCGAEEIFSFSTFYDTYREEGSGQQIHNNRVGLSYWYLPRSKEEGFWAEVDVSVPVSFRTEGGSRPFLGFMTDTCAGWAWTGEYSFFWGRNTFYAGLGGHGSYGLNFGKTLLTKFSAFGPSLMVGSSSSEGRLYVMYRVHWDLFDMNDLYDRRSLSWKGGLDISGKLGGVLSIGYRY